MSMTPKRLAGLTLLWMAIAAPAWADSVASSASSAGSASVGSLSESVRGSSNSSSRDNQVAEGEYRVVEVAELDGRPGMLRLRLQAQQRPGDAGELWLDLSQQALERRGLAAGDLIRAQHRPYGVEFAYADTREAFFLVLADAWRHELDPRAVTL